MILLALLVRRRKKRQQAQGGLQQPPGLAQIPPGYEEHWQGAGKPAQNLDGSYSGFKYELPATETPSHHGASPNLSTASPDQKSASNVSTLMMPGHGGSVGYVSPQSTGTEGYAGSYHGYGESGQVSELQ